MKKSNRILSIVIVVSFLFTIYAITTSASYYTTKQKSGASEFNNTWDVETQYRKYIDDPNAFIKIGTMIWGFDPTFIDEDYTWTCGLNNNNSQASVFRNGYDSNSHYGDYKISGAWSRIDVTHKTTTVTYGIYLSGSFTGYRIYGEDV